MSQILAVPTEPGRVTPLFGLKPEESDDDNSMKS